MNSVMGQAMRRQERDEERKDKGIGLGAEQSKNQEENKELPNFDQKDKIHGEEETKDPKKAQEQTRG